MNLRLTDRIPDELRWRMDLDNAVGAFELDVIEVIALDEVADALAGVGFGVDDVTGTDAL